jgi:hypothetical protein
MCAVPYEYAELVLQALVLLDKRLILRLHLFQQCLVFAQRIFCGTTRCVVRLRLNVNTQVAVCRNLRFGFRLGLHVLLAHF